MTFAQELRKLFATFGYPLKTGAGVSQTTLDKAAKRLGITLPAAVETYYLLAGKERQFNQAHNRLLPPSEWTVRRGRLVFLDENQSVCCWGVSVQSANDDPPVSQTTDIDEADERDVKWYLEHRRFSTFMLVMLHWQAVCAGMPVSGMSPSAKLPKLDKSWRKFGPVSKGTAYSRTGQVVFHEPSMGLLVGTKSKKSMEELSAAWNLDLDVL